MPDTELDSRLAPRTIVTVPDGDYLRVQNKDGSQTLIGLRATEEEQQRAYHGALRRELEGIEHRLAHLDDPVEHWMPVPHPGEVERTRTSLENTREHILRELGEDAKPARRRGKR
jgi:hypothetical protein